MSWQNVDRRSWWTRDRDDALREMYHTPKVTGEMIAKALGTTVPAVRKRTRVLGIARANNEVWTSALDQQMRDLWEAGLSFSCIAAEMGMTRGACIGRSRRLGFPKRMVKPKTVKPRKPGQPRKPRSRPRYDIRRGVKPDCPRTVVVPMRQPPPGAPVSLDIPLSDIQRGQCHHIAGEPTANALMCGHPTVRGCWCEYHYRLVYRSEVRVQHEEAA